MIYQNNQNNPVHETLLGLVRVPADNEFMTYDFIAIVYKNNGNIPVLRYVYDLYNEPRLQVVLDYINDNNLATYSHCEFMTNELVIIHFDNINPKLLLEYI
jgi:hypothetical protein